MPECEVRRAGSPVYFDDVSNLVGRERYLNSERHLLYIPFLNYDEREALWEKGGKEAKFLSRPEAKEKGGLRSSFGLNTEHIHLLLE